MLADYFFPLAWWLYVAATLLQLAYAGGVLARFPKKNGSEQGVPPEKWPPLSLIVCARNEAHNLRQCLPGMLAQDYPGDWELLLVDDASSDDSPHVLAGFSAQNAQLRVLRLAEKTAPGKKNALEMGIGQARHPLLVLSDADCRPSSPQWLRHMAAAACGGRVANGPRLVLGFGPMRKRQPETAWNRWLRFEAAQVAAQYLAFAQAGMPYMGVGRNLALPKRLFEQSGGFAAHRHIISGDDDLLVNHAASARHLALCLHPDAFVFSDGKPTWQGWLRQKRRHLSAGWAYRWPHQVLLASLSLSQVLHYFCLLLLLLGAFRPLAALLLYLLRLLILWRCYGRIFRQLGEPDLLPYFPLLDLCQTLYQGSVLPWLLFQRHQRSW
jgi:cellulose synthase/poly-beta-1,6-N-acetylglucosamine synthase-like glycosyltransferase